MLRDGKTNDNMKTQVEKFELMSNEKKVWYADVAIAMCKQELEGVESVLIEIDRLPSLQQKYTHVYLERAQLLEEIEYYTNEKRKITQQ